MKTDKRKIVIVGTGMVGMSYAYCLLNQSVCDELVLIDVDKKRAEGEAMDLNHGLAFAGSSMKIYAGDYESCQDADLVLIAAGVAQKQGETRLDLLKRNTQVFRSIIEPVTASGFNGIFLVATNPVDIMTRITCALSGFNPRRVLGSGTALDTARLRYLLGEYLGVDPRNIHAYVMGEHGDSEFVPWSQAFLATKSISQLDWELESSLTAHLLRIEEEVRTAAYKIIEAKKSTYYGIGMALTRITKAILGDEHSVLTVSAMLRGEYGQRDVYVGVPCIINQNGIQRVLPLSLTEDELENLYTVPFFIWTNYETETEEVPITSLNYLSTMALERAGIALPSYNQFLADMQQTIPAINSRGYYSVSSGCFKHLEEATGEEAEWIDRYQILQYNNMFDKKKQSKVFFPYLKE